MEFILDDRVFDDFVSLSREPNKLSILMEFKHVKGPEAQNLSEVEITHLLEKSAQEALIQIDQKSYITELKQRNLTHVLKIGLAFSGEQFCLVYNKIN